MSIELSSSAQRVQQAIHERGFHCEVVELPGSTRTAQDAATAVGCELAQIVKSLVFATTHTHLPVLVLVSGANRVNEQRLADALGEPIGKADGDFVRKQTGFAIGGIPPLGHIQPIKTFIDADLMKLEDIWAAAGTPHAVFHLKSADLLSMTGGQVINIT
jgi:prolyl-tRNA editing enzyme YbaK/EbsC (Cys-tRNA(Pro) deacylase)